MERRKPGFEFDSVGCSKENQVFFFWIENPKKVSYDRYRIIKILGMPEWV